MVDGILAKWMNTVSQRSLGNLQLESQSATDVPDALQSQVPYMFDMADHTWPNVYLFGPVGRSFGAFIHRDQKRHCSSTSTSPTSTSAFVSTSTSDSTSSSSSSWSAVLEVSPAANAAPSYIDVSASLQSAAADLVRLYNAYQVEKVRPCRNDTAERYLDFLLHLEAFLFFLLWHGVPSFIHANLLQDIFELHRDTFRPLYLTDQLAVEKFRLREPAAFEKLRAQDLWDRRCAHQQGCSRPGKPFPVARDATVAILPKDWIDPRAGNLPTNCGANAPRKVGIFSRSQVVVFGVVPTPVQADLKRHLAPDGMGEQIAKRPRTDSDTEWVPGPPLAPVPQATVVSYKVRPRAGTGAFAPSVGPVLAPNAISSATPPPTVDSSASRNPSLPSSIVDSNNLASTLNSLLRQAWNLDSTLVNREPTALHSSTSLARDSTAGAPDSSARNPIASQSSFELASTGKSTTHTSTVNSTRDSTHNYGLLDSIARHSSLDSTALNSDVRESTQDSRAVGSTAQESSWDSSTHSTRDSTTSRKSPLHQVISAHPDRAHGSRYARSPQSDPDPVCPSPRGKTISASGKAKVIPDSSLTSSCQLAAHSASAPPPPLARSSRDVSVHHDGAKTSTKTRTKTKQHGVPVTQNMRTQPILPFAQNIPAAPGAPLILGAGCVMTFEVSSQTPRVFGAETRRGDAEALVEWFLTHARGGQPNVEWVRYLREVLRVAGMGLTSSRNEAEAKMAASSSSSSPPSSFEGTTSLGLVLERVANAPRSFGDATVHNDGRAVRAFLKTRPAAEVGRYVEYLKEVLEEVVRGLGVGAGERLD
ncbi:hypothetical protein B0H11DRAFT_2061773 [Mycena galericulata]|nr:hypothetical protein B0H11DRAFT_2061773 [Mycena galericulata]